MTDDKRPWDGRKAKGQRWGNDIPDSGRIPKILPEVRFDEMPFSILLRLTVQHERDREHVNIISRIGADNRPGRKIQEPDHGAGRMVPPAARVRTPIAGHPAGMARFFSQQQDTQRNVTLQRASCCIMHPEPARQLPQTIWFIVAPSIPSGRCAEPFCAPGCMLLRPAGPGIWPPAGACRLSLEKTVVFPFLATFANSHMILLRIPCLNTRAYFYQYLR
jgi:hypothetical protein